MSSDRKVDFLVCGTQKGGTTALDAYLREHSEICMADVKEVHYFDNEVAFTGGNPDYTLYHANFSPLERHKVIGEVTPIYMYWSDAPRRIWQYNPLMKLIVLLRNPIERAYSHWNMESARNAEHLPFFDAIQREEKRCREALPEQHRVFSYVDRGFYVDQLRRLRAFFPDEQLLVLKSEDLRHDPLATLNKVCRFLGLSELSKVEARVEHSRQYQAPMDKRSKAYLLDVYEFQIKELERLLGWDCSDWLNCGSSELKSGFAKYFKRKAN